jgi:hypoxanthine phosphoribosyltransferase
VDLSTAGGDIDRVIVTAPEIQARLKEIARQVELDYDGRDLLVIGILKGAVMTLAQLPS